MQDGSRAAGVVAQHAHADDDVGALGAHCLTLYDCWQRDLNHSSWASTLPPTVTVTK